MIKEIEKIISHIRKSSDSDEELSSFTSQHLEQLGLDTIDMAIAMGKVADRFVKGERKELSLTLYERAIDILEKEDTDNDIWVLLNKALLNEKTERFEKALQLYYKCRDSSAEGEEFLDFLLRAMIERTRGKLAVKEGVLNDGVEHYKLSAAAFKELKNSETNPRMRKKWFAGEMEMRSLAEKYLRK
jgi:tetratricopeptide (TPR) repeat protein